MINCENNTVKIEGVRINLITELMCIMRSFIEQGVVSKHDLIECSMLVCMSKDDIKQAIIDTIDEMDDIGDALILLQSLERI